MSISTSLPELEPSFPPASPYRRRTRRGPRFPTRSLISVGLVVVVLLTGIGAFLFYENTLPTTFATNFKNGQKDVPSDSRILLTFSRPVSLSAVQAAFSITPDVDGAITSLDGQKEYAWSATKGLNDLTTYLVTVKPIVDLSRHRVQGSTWTFTTLIVPHITSITAAAGTPLADGTEIDAGTTLRLNFNDAMEPETMKVTLGGQVVNATWAADNKSATVSTAGIASGPLQVQVAAGGRDQTGHVVPGAFIFNTGIYFHDHEHTTALRYPAIIQVPNDSEAWDQSGLQAADIVWEYLAEGGITRLTAMYDNAPDLIGPMRSARFISLKLGRHYKGLLFQSGESAATQARAAQDPTPQFFDVIGYQFRAGPPRYAPDNLMIKGPVVKAAEDNYFSSIPSYTIPKARPVLGPGSPAASINVDEHYSVYTYDAATGTYRKSELGHPYSDAGLGQPLRIEMLITLHTKETLLKIGDGHGSLVHDFDLDSSGRFEANYKGMVYGGTWSSTDSHGPLTFTLDDGQVLTLPPGLVWIDVTA